MAELQELVFHNNTEGESSNAAPQKSELTVDEIIEQHVGSFGFSQLLHVFLVSLAWMFDSQNTLVTIFSDAQPQWRCKGSSSSCSVHRSICELEKGKSSTIAEWGLICDKKFRAGVPASLFFVGSLLVHGRLADKYLGRKKTVLLSCLLTAITSFVTSFSPNIWVYTFLRFSNGFARSGIGICCLVLSTETVGRKWRGQVGQYGFFFFTIGFLSLPLIAYPARRSWRNLYKVISILPLAYSLLIIPFISESPRWLAIKGRTDEAMGVLTKLAKLNGKFTKKLVVGKMGAKKDRYDDDRRFRDRFQPELQPLLHHPRGVLRQCVLKLHGPVMHSLHPFLEEGKLSVEAVGFMAASMAFDVLYIYCVELFATNVRNFAVSMLRQALMLGAAIAPLLVVLGRLNPKLSFLIFGVLAVISGSITFWLPETKNAPLYDTLEQQEQQEKEEKLSSAPEREMELVGVAT
ncbi:Organic cation/carnitine transporter 1 [Ananas comosus]|uniref:H(+)/Pi cotransporter n=1 Tax=Ananas comosus TaxID=4615 RepID=A0A199VMX0_ANACO|nr:Organic cation/carnitine transporter 1 [Ananas comosus]